MAERCAAYATRMPAGYVFSHQTAAVLWGMPLPFHLDTGRIHVTTSAPARAPSGRSVTGHSLALGAEDTGIRRGLPVTSPAVTWVHLSTVLSVHDLVAVGDFALTGNPFRNILPLLTRDQLEAAHAARELGRGRRARELALPALREGPLSRPESILRYFLEWAGIRAPEINPSLLDERGSFLAMPDLAWPEFRFAVEYEGDHHRGVDRFRRDIRRIEQLVDAGWTVLKASADDLFDRPDELVARIARRLVALGWTPPRELRRIARIRR